METNFIERVINAVSNIVGCQFVHLEYNSIVKLNKAQMALIGGSVVKNVSGEFQLNYGYENAVNRRLSAIGEEAQFKAQSLPWGAWLVVNKLIVNKGKTYLRFYEVANDEGDVTYYINGVKATDEQTALINAWTKKSGSATQSAVGLTEHQVVPKVLEIGNIVKIVINKETIINEDSNLKLTA